MTDAETLASRLARCEARLKACRRRLADREFEQLRHSRLLFAEGKDTAHFLDAMRRRLRLPDTDIRDFGGVDELPDTLEAAVADPRFRDVTRLGVFRDAERRPARQAFQGVCGALHDANLPPPDRPGIWREGAVEDRRITVGVFVLPDNETPGMLETLLYRTVAGNPVGRCIEEPFECAGIPTDSPRQDKRRARALLATKKQPHPSVGIAAKMGYWNLDHQVLEPLGQFLGGLDGER